MYRMRLVSQFYKQVLLLICPTNVGRTSHNETLLRVVGILPYKQEQVVRITNTEYPMANAIVPPAHQENLGLMVRLP